MKKLLIIPLLVATINIFGQGKPKPTRYFEYTVEFTLTSGCESSAWATYATTNNYAITYGEAKFLIAKWVKPNKLKSFKLSGVREIKKSEQQKSTKFKCPEPTKVSLFTDTVTNFSYTSWYPIMSPMIKIQSFPSFSKMDSVVLTVKKSQLRWVNDSTAIITK